MGTSEYERIVRRHRVPVVVTGFEPVDLLEGILLAVRQLESGQAMLENPYARVVRRDGNAHARALVRRVFRVGSQRWRGMGELPDSGLALRPPFASMDAVSRFNVDQVHAEEDPRCQAGLVLQGRLAPPDCAAFASPCTPAAPLGAPMVSAEGTCAAYYRYRNAEIEADNQIDGLS
jgi:hydrogenase expression/formation protein HypD